MIDRRQFAKAAGASLAVVASSTAAAHSVPAPLPLIKPKRLKEGDTVGLVLPASMSFETDPIDRAREQLEAIGFKVKLGEHAYGKHGYFSGTDQERAADVNAMFRDPAIDGIVCFTGGWGTPRILPLLDYGLIRRNPKVLIGFSDITALINAVHLKTGLVTFHGPVGESRIEPWTLENMKRVIMSSSPIGTLSNPPKEERDLVPWQFRVSKINGGKARGRLVGGNLTLIAATMGTPYEINTEGAILFLEDVDEALYRIDRMLTQLWLGGKFEKIAGFIFGYCSECPAGGPAFSLGELLAERAPRKVPAISGLAVGHIPRKLTLPIGMQATLDADAGTVTIDDAAVV
jgi:muramoyltetrapeptide carboxypeptidase